MGISKIPSYEGALPKVSLCGTLLRMGQEQSSFKTVGVFRDAPMSIVVN